MSPWPSELPTTLGCVVILLVGVASPADAQITASVAINLSSPKAVFPSAGLGVHTSPYYNEFAASDLPARIEDAGLTTLRYGGGGYADVFHWSITRAQWENGIQGGGLSPFWGQDPFDPDVEFPYGYVGPQTDFASFVGILDQIANSQAVVTVNYGSALKLQGGYSLAPDYGGQPEEAAAWVAYANADPAIYGTIDDVPLGLDQQGNDWKTAGYWARLRASTPQQYQTWAGADGLYDPLNEFLAIDRDAAVGIEYWEIGNETFGTGYYDGGTGYSVDYDVPYDGANRRFNPALSPAQYATDLVEYAQLMRAVDPSVKIGAVLATPPNDYDWSYPDYNLNGHKDDNEPYWNDEVLSIAADQIDFVMMHWYVWAGNDETGESLLQQLRDDLPRMINGTTPGQDSGRNEGVRDTLATHGLSDAEIMITEFNYFYPSPQQQTPLPNDVEAVYVADAYATWLEEGVQSVQYLELLTKDFLDDNNDLQPGSAYYGVAAINELAKPGDTFLDAESTDELVRVHAARQADGGLAVMLLNHSVTQSADVSVDLGAFRAMDQGVLFSVLDGQSLNQSPVSGLSGGLNASLPPKSILVYLLAEASLPGDYNGDGRVDAKDYATWRESLGSAALLPGDVTPGAVTVSDFDVWLANFGSTQQAPPATVPEPTGLTMALLSLTPIIFTPRLRRRPGPQGNLAPVPQRARPVVAGGRRL